MQNNKSSNLKKISREVNSKFKKIHQSRELGLSLSREIIGISSRSIRSAQRKDFKNAEKMLGHKWLIKGKVISGDKRGREIGFPTANMEVQDFMEIKFGVYAVKIEIEGYIYNGISNYGIRPTFDGEKLLLETYLFDF